MSPWALVATAGLALTFAAGAAGGLTLLSGPSGHALARVLAFGRAALLYLVTEELLAEAHKVPEPPLSTSLFFAGFLLFLVLGIFE